MKYIIFDYDGTLHNSIKIYKPAFMTAYDYLVDLYMKFLKGEISASSYQSRIQCFCFKINSILSKYIPL